MANGTCDDSGSTPCWQRSVRGCGRCASERGTTLAQLSEDHRDLGEHAVPAGVRASGGRRWSCCCRWPGPTRCRSTSWSDAPPTGDPRVHAAADRARRHALLPLTRRPGGLQAFKQIIPPAAAAGGPEQKTHEGYEWLYVLSGRLRLVLGEHDIVLTPGEVAEFDTRVPHWIGNPGPGPTEILSLFGPQGERLHVRARPARGS